MKITFRLCALLLAMLLCCSCLTACGKAPASTPDPNPDTGEHTDDPNQDLQNNQGNNQGNSQDNSQGNTETAPSIQPMFLYDGENLLRLKSDGKITADGFTSAFLWKNYSAVVSVGMNSHCAYVLTEGGGLHLTGSNKKGMLCDEDLTKTYTEAHRILVSQFGSSTVLHFAMSETLCVALTQDSLYAWGEFCDNTKWGDASLPWEGITATPVKLDLPQGITPQDVTDLWAGEDGFWLSAKGNCYHLGHTISVSNDGTASIVTEFNGSFYNSGEGVKARQGNTFTLYLKDDGTVFVEGTPGFKDLYHYDDELFSEPVEKEVWLYTPVAIRDIAVYESGAALLGEDGSVYVIGKLGKNTYSTLQRVIVPAPMSYVSLNAYGLMMANADAGFDYSYAKLSSALRPVFN